MKRSKYCSKHGRRHSVHAQMHCETDLPVGKCVDKKGQVRAGQCPAVQHRDQRRAL